MEGNLQLQALHVGASRGHGWGISLCENSVDVANMLCSNIAGLTESDFENVAGEWLSEAMPSCVLHQSYVDVPKYKVANGAREIAKYQEALQVSASEALEEMLKQVVREAHVETRELVPEEFVETREQIRAGIARLYEIITRNESTTRKVPWTVYARLARNL